MRAVFVNYSHPDTPHVSGVRVPAFARALARKGHRILLLTKSLGDGDHRLTPDEIARALDAHDWEAPLLVACPPARDARLERLRRGELPPLVSKATVVAYYLAKGGVFSDWVQGTEPLWSSIASSFKPQIVWGTFGNTDTWQVMREIASRSACPWVGDIKDGWDPFVPKPLRAILAWRFRDAAGFTANSRLFSAQIEKWFSQRAEVVYSGVADEFFQAPDGGEPAEPPCVTLTGGLYSDHALRLFLQAFAEVQRGRLRVGGQRLRLVYAGGDGRRLEKTAGSVDGLDGVEVHGYLPLRDLAHLCRGASVNAYLWHSSTFHHKLLELLSCGRPVLAFPGESAESTALTARVGAGLHIASSYRELTQTLVSLLDHTPRTFEARVPLRSQFSWEAQASLLERFLESKLPAPARGA